MTTTSAGGYTGGAEAPRQGHRTAWLSPVNLAIAVTTLVALVLRGYLLVRPGVLTVTQYDDGPYFGSAVRLVHGVLPYRDFAFVQPPGITVLLSPVGLLTYLTGTAWGLGIARILTLLAGSAAVALTGLLVRHRGILAVLLACGVVAIYPPAANASHTVLLEPWLVLFCLIGAVTVFDGDRITASTRRLVWGGVMFGLRRRDQGVGDRARPGRCRAVRARPAPCGHVRGRRGRRVPRRHTAVRRRLSRAVL